MPPGFSTQLINSWGEYVDRVRDKQDWIFRGQAADWELSTSIQRYSVPHVAPVAAEIRVYREFQRRAHQYLQAQSLPSIDAATLSWLSLMQHHGAPTRLLDWTRSPFVALFFAWEDPQSEAADASPVVWAVDNRWIYEAAVAAVGRELKEFDKPAEELLHGFATLGGPFESFINKAPRAVVPADPWMLHERVSLQQAVFLCPGNLNVSFLENLIADSADAANHVTKLQLSFGWRVEALRRLRLTMSISRASLFPGLDGFAQSLRHYMITRTPAEDLNWNAEDAAKHGFLYR